MKLDFKHISAYIDAAQGVEDELKKHQELFDPEKMSSFQQETRSLIQKCEIAQQDSRKLNIGIIGAVKAGKSSFLNACIFGGEELLPKAATPMTAALTKISYSEAPKAIIHFYTHEDWNEIEKLSSQYDARLEAEYADYKNREQKNRERIRSSGILHLEPIKPKQEFERSIQSRLPEIQRGAKELTRMVTDCTLLNRLEQTDTIEGDIIGQLQEYVGVNGRYTPIVSYVELQVDKPWMKELEIVDTPGLNDPIVSRGIVTKKFLRSCDVAILLSPCSQFMDSNTIALMANSLPDSGVREIMVVGSKLDSGILNEQSELFSTAYKKAVNSYQQQFHRCIMSVQANSRNGIILEQMKKSSLHFVSSMCFTIAQKNKNGKPLDKEEQHVLKNLHRFSDFEDSKLSALGGIRNVQKELNAVLERKAAIIEEQNGNLLSVAQYNHRQFLDLIQAEVTSSRETLETVSADELRQRKDCIRDVIDSSRKKIMGAFDGAIIDCENRIKTLIPQLSSEKQHCRTIDIKENKYLKHYTSREGFLGLKRVTREVEVIDYKVNTTAAKENIESYVNRCNKRAQEEFNNIFNKQQFTEKIKEIMLKAFDDSSRDMDESEIIDPIINVLKKISVPLIKIDYTDYMDEIDTRFNSGFAQNEEIDQLIQLQTKLLARVEKEIGEQLQKNLEDIADILRKQATSFADEIERGFFGEIEKLETQVEEKEKYIAQYRKFRNILQELKDKLKV